nr:MAG TPA: hypothetical protein [Bacteriophage sp.]
MLPLSTRSALKVRSKSDQSRGFHTKTILHPCVKWENRSTLCQRIRLISQK